MSSFLDRPVAMRLWRRISAVPRILVSIVAAPVHLPHRRYEFIFTAASRRGRWSLAVTVINYLERAHGRRYPGAADVPQDGHDRVIVVAGVMFGKHMQWKRGPRSPRLSVWNDRRSADRAGFPPCGLQRFQRPRRFGRRNCAPREEHSASHHPGTAHCGGLYLLANCRLLPVLCHSRRWRNRSTWLPT